MVPAASLEQRFKEFVAELFLAEGYEVEREPKGTTAAIPDLVVLSQRKTRAVVELKLYRSREMPASNLRLQLPSNFRAEHFKPSAAS
jgi:hypothetical protein